MKNDNWLSRTLPWFGGEKLEHVKVNGWSNGWIIDSHKLQAAPLRQGFEGQTIDKPIESAEEDTFTVVIVYWPQYLQWLGFGILIVTIVGLGVSLYHPHRPNR